METSNKNQNKPKKYQGTILLNGLTLISAWISNHMPWELWDNITHSFPNFNGCTVEVWEWIRNFILYIPMLELKLNRDSQKGAHGIHFQTKIKINQIKPCIRDYI